MWTMHNVDYLNIILIYHVYIIVIIIIILIAFATSIFTIVPSAVTVIIYVTLLQFCKL